MYALNERISRRVTLAPLLDDEVHAYIEHRLSIAGGSEAVHFDEDAIRLVADFSRGLPRRVNLLCDRALDQGRLESAELITAEMLKRAASLAGRRARAVLSPDTPADAEPPASRGPDWLRPGPPRPRGRAGVAVRSRSSPLRTSPRARVAGRDPGLVRQRHERRAVADRVACCSRRLDAGRALAAVCSGTPRGERARGGSWRARGTAPDPGAGRTAVGAPRAAGTRTAGVARRARADHPGLRHSAPRQSPRARPTRRRAWARCRRSRAGPAAVGSVHRCVRASHRSNAFAQRVNVFSSMAPAGSGR